MAKIIDYQSLKSISQSLKFQNKKTVLVTGVFDLLHSAHFKFLTKAKTQGDLLFVGIESDKRVQKIKGYGRPVQDQNLRLQNISNLKFVDYVFILPQNFDSKKDHENLISNLKPDILAVSSHTPFLKQKKEVCNKFNCILKIVIKKDKSISTSQILKIYKK